jgi:hypothetical protein
LAFLPIEDVIVGFEIVKSKAPASFKKMFDYIERTYVGRYRENKKNITKWKKPRFDLKSWNVRDRVILNLPRTQNNQESWHGSINPTISKGLYNISCFYFHLFEYIFLKVLLVLV